MKKQLQKYWLSLFIVMSLFPFSLHRVYAESDLMSFYDILSTEWMEEWFAEDSAQGGVTADTLEFTSDTVGIVSTGEAEVFSGYEEGFPDK